MLLVAVLLPSLQPLRAGPSVKSTRLPVQVFTKSGRFSSQEIIDSVGQGQQKTFEPVNVNEISFTAFTPVHTYSCVSPGH